MTFKELYQSSFSGLIKKELFDNAMENINEQVTWYEVIFDTSPVIVSAVKGNDVKVQLMEWVSKIEKSGYHSRFDWFYTNRIDKSEMIKIYNPLKCGCSGGEPPSPWVVFTTVKPSDEELKPFEKSPKGLVDNVVCRLKTIRNFLP